MEVKSSALCKLSRENR